ncbi:aminoglycoside phosphotransferase family protein [bacterium]|nr:aminoglycoside phosphotransferase family protein [bacterium]
MRKLTELSVDEIANFHSTLNQFSLGGEVKRMFRLYQGHLHETYVSEVRVGENTKKYLHQKINTTAFENPELMLSNIQRISKVLKMHPEREFSDSLTLIPTVDDEPYHSDGKLYWRTYNFVEDSISYDICPNDSKGYALGNATGEFLYLLSEMPCSEIYDYSPDFQDTFRRWSELQEALSQGVPERLQTSKCLYEEMRSFEEDALQIHKAVKGGKLRQQIIHGDTKTNNFLFRENSDEVLCLVDIDLCMPATPLYDIGDLLRSASAVGREDERDLSQVGVDSGIMEAVLRGFLSSRFELTDAEKSLLSFAGFTVSFNLTARFLADYLRGDVYFPVTRPNHNLERALAQWRVTTCLHSFRYVIEDLVASAPHC